MNLEGQSLKVKNYKCFGNLEQGFESIKPINLIIGRNNSGKSALLDIVDYAIKPKPIQQLGHKGNSPKIILGDVLKLEDLLPVFPATSSGGGIPGRNFWEFGQQWVGKKIFWAETLNGKELLEIIPPFNMPQGKENFESHLMRLKKSPLEGKIFKRIFAERNIVPEGQSDAEMNVNSNGSGATHVIQNFINKSNLPSELVEVSFLHELNVIFKPDCTFERILVQQMGGANAPWEIYLEEKNKGRIQISQSGSALKTVILVLIYLYLIPNLEKRKLSEYIFAFEELENNLHPALQRRLLQYIDNIAKNQGAHFFLTTHSNISIDYFSKNKDAQIIHVTHDGDTATAKQVTAYLEHKGILDDLDVRASDLLQSNCIIWVEGPSDRLYVNKWIELITNGQLKEGAHYQCVFYGGRLLAHLTASVDDVEEGIRILMVNKNAIILIDSDKRDKSDPINSTKQRIVSEIERIGGLSWVTEGKEIENYITSQAISSLYSDKISRQIGDYEDFDVYLDSISLGEGKRFLNDKVSFAEKVSQNLRKEDLEIVMDWKAKIEELCNKIRVWNK